MTIVGTLKIFRTSDERQFKDVKRDWCQKPKEVTLKSSFKKAKLKIKACFNRRCDLRCMINVKGDGKVLFVVHIPLINRAVGTITRMGVSSSGRPVSWWCSFEPAGPPKIRMVYRVTSKTGKVTVG